MQVEIFCCYAHEDQALLKKLITHLASLERQGYIRIWADKDIGAGAEWEQEINKHLNIAHIILLLVSPDFIASDYCYSKEMVRALERHEQSEARVIPIILRPVHWQGALFGKLQALPTNRKPVTSWRKSDEAFVAIVDEIRRIVDDLRKPLPQGDPIVREAVQKLVKGSGEQIDAVKRIINVLDELGQEQKKVSELKSVHNMLHEVEVALAPLTRWFSFSKRKEVQVMPDIDYIENEWREVWRKIGALRYFAEQKMTYLEERRLKVGNDSMSGPLWIVELLNAQNDFDASLEERNIQGMGDALDDLLHKCRTHLQWINGRLLMAVDQVDQLSDKILRSLHFDSTTNI